tara:strand:+ start:126 stop:647 length:522 start_codon:yes stop_codon:yes gene_type:complete
MVSKLKDIIKESINNNEETYDLKTVVSSDDIINNTIGPWMAISESSWISSKNFCPALKGSILNKGFVTSNVDMYKHSRDIDDDIPYEDIRIKIIYPPKDHDYMKEVSLILNNGNHRISLIKYYKLSFDVPVHIRGYQYNEERWKKWMNPHKVKGVDKYHSVSTRDFHTESSIK